MDRQIERLEPRVVLSGPRTVNSVVLSPDGQHTAEIVQTGNTSSVIEDGKTVGGPFLFVSELQFSPAGDHLAFIAEPATTQQFQVFEDGKVLHSSSSEPSAITFSADGKHIAFRIPNGTVSESIFQWEGVFNMGPSTFATNGTSVFEDGKVVGGTYVIVSTLKFAPGDHLLFVGENRGLIDGSFQIVRDGAVIKTIGFNNNLEDFVTEFTVSPDGTHTAFIVIENNGQPGAPTTATAVVEDGKQLFSGQSFLGIGDLQFSATGDHLAFLGVKANGSQVFEDGAVVTGQTFGSVTSLQFSPAGNNLAFIAFNAGSTSAQVFENGKLVAGGQTFGNVNQLQFSPDGKHLAFVGFNAGNTKAQVFEDGNLVAAGANFGNVTSLQFSPQGDNLAFIGLSPGATSAQVFRNGNVAAGGASFGSVSALQYSADGNHLAFIGFNAGRSQAQVFEDGHVVVPGVIFGDVRELQFSPVGDHLAFIGLNVGATSAQVFDIGGLVGGPFGSVTLLQFSPDASRLTYVADGALKYVLVAPALTANAATLNAGAGVLIIKGIGFSVTPGNNVVTLSGGATGTVIQATTTQLTVGNLKHLRAGILTATVSSHGANSGAPTQVATVLPVVTANTTDLKVNATTLILHGFGFDPTKLSNNIVTLSNGAKATVVSATNNALTITVSGLKLGALRATVNVDGHSNPAPVQVATVVHA